MASLDLFTLCPWTPAACFFLATCYLSIFVFVCVYLRKLVIGATIKRGAQKLFLVVVLLNNVLRITYFMLWPFYGPCTPQLKTSLTEAWLHVLGNIPGSVFLSAFSILVWTFARIYHLILRQEIRGDVTKYYCIIVLLVLFNLTMYTVTIIDMVTDSSIFGPAPVYATTGTSGSLALLFLAYGAGSYVQVKSVLRNTGQTPYFNHPKSDGDGDRAKEMIYPSVLTATSSDDEDQEEESIRHTPSHSVTILGSSRRDEEDSSPLRSPTGDFQNVSLGSDFGSKGKNRGFSDGVQMIQTTPSKSKRGDAYSAWSPPFKQKKIKKPKKLLGSNPHNNYIPPKSSSKQKVTHRNENDYISSPNKIKKKETRNPMRKIAVVAAICCICFLLRTSLLGLMLEEFEEQPWAILVPYFGVAEIIPLMLLLYVFNSSATWTSPDALRDLQTRGGEGGTAGGGGGGGGGDDEEGLGEDYGGGGYQQPLLH